MTLLLGLLIGLPVGILIGAWLVCWQQEAEQREKYLPPTWTPAPPEGWWP